MNDRTHTTAAIPPHDIIMPVEVMKVVYTQIQARIVDADHDRGVRAIRFLLGQDQNKVKLGQGLLLAVHGMEDEDGAKCMYGFVSFVRHLARHQLNLCDEDTERAIAQFDQDPRQAIRLIIGSFEAPCIKGSTEVLLTRYYQGTDGRLRLEKSLEKLQEVSPLVIRPGLENKNSMEFFENVIDSVVFASRFGNALFEILKEHAGLPTNADVSAVTE